MNAPGTTVSGIRRKVVVGFVAIATAATLVVCGPKTSTIARVKPTPRIVVPGVGTSGTIYYVSPDGTRRAPCTLDRPCDIPRLNEVMKPGDVAYLRGGTYRGPISISTVGSATEKIVIRSYPPDGLYAANIECKGLPGDWCVKIVGADTWMWGVRVNDSDPLPRSYEDIDAFRKNQRPICVGLFGTRNGFVNGIAENCEVGLSTGSAPQYGAYVYGNLIYYNGSDVLATRGTGHNTYLQSGADYTDPSQVTLVMDNVTHDAWNMSNHQYGESVPPAPHGLLNYIRHVGNTDFANGRTSKRPTQGTAWVIGANGTAASGPPDYPWCDANGVPLSTKLAINPVLDSNDVYMWSSGDVAIYIYTKGVANLTVTNNYLASHDHSAKAHIFTVTGDNVYGTTTMTRNTFIGMIEGKIHGAAIPPQFPGNTFLATPPSSGYELPHYRPNLLEPGRGKVSLFNWGHSSTVKIDPSRMGAFAGEQYVIKSAMDPLGPALASGVYAGGSITVPTTGTVERPAGDPTTFNMPTDLGPEFMTYLLYNAAPAPAPTSTAAAVPGKQGAPGTTAPNAPSTR